MAFNYEQIVEAAPCYALIKNLRYEKDDYGRPIKKGELIAIAKHESELRQMIPKPPMAFKTIRQLKRFLYRCEMMQDIDHYKGDELLKVIDKDKILNWDAIYKPGRTMEEIVRLCFQSEYFGERDFYYDYTGSAYHNESKIRDYQIFDECYDMPFFCGDDREKLYLFFVDLIREQHSQGQALSAIFNNISANYMDRIASYNGETSGYEMWEYLQDKLRNEPIPGITLNPGEDWGFADYMGEK